MCHTKQLINSIASTALDKAEAGDSGTAIPDETVMLGRWVFSRLNWSTVSVLVNAVGI